MTKISRLTALNAPALTAAAAEILDGPVRPDSLAQFLSDPRHFMFLAMDGQSCVGMASCFEYYHPDKLPQIFLNEIGVAESHQSQGIGRALVAAVLAEADVRGADYVWLGTEVDNLPANACFSKIEDTDEWERDLEECDVFKFYGWEKT